jgi:hypothetical protein
MTRFTSLALLAAVSTLVGCAPGEPRGDSFDDASPDSPLVSISTFEACARIADLAHRLTDAAAEQRTDSFPAFTGPTKRHGCVVRVTGPVTAAQPVPALATTLVDSLGDGWQRDPAIAADGPTETVYGLWHGDVLCLVRVDWGRSAEGGAPRVAAETYSGTIGCEERRDHTLPPS